MQQLLQALAQQMATQQQQQQTTAHAEQNQALMQQLAAQQQQQVTALLQQQQQRSDMTKSEQRKAFLDIEKFTGKGWKEYWQYDFKIVTNTVFTHGADILNWAEDKGDTPILLADIGAMVSGNGWTEALNLNGQLHSILNRSMAAGTEAKEIVRSTAESAGLGTWRRLCHRYDPANTISKLVQLTTLIKEQPHVGPTQVMRGVEKWEQEMNKAKHR